MSTEHGSAGPDGWYLEGYAAEGETWLVPLRTLPFLIGRGPDCQLHLSSLEVSRHHAQIDLRGGVLWLRDLGSTNGTFLNRQRVSAEMALKSGDILHFASVEFRVGQRAAVAVPLASGPDSTHYSVTAELPRHFVPCAAAFEQMLRQRAVVSYYQPIVRLADASTVAFELLGRGAFEGVPTGAGELWAVAHSLGQEVELSELFRQSGVQQARALADGWQLFVNSDPAEMNPRHLERSLVGLRRMAPELAIVLEINERAVTDLSMMRWLRALLDELGMALAYDDFGAGQARLVELIEVPPNYLKFDIVLVRNIDRQPPRAQQALQALVRMTRDLGISALAEGLETRGEAETCSALGFDLAQGFYFGRPAPLERYLGATRPAAPG